MKILLTILLFSCTTTSEVSNKTASQPVLNWTTGDENTISYYVIQSSSDTLHWTTIDTVHKGRNVYTYTLQSIDSKYYRIGAIGYINFYTKWILLLNTSANRAEITTPKISSTFWTDNLTWATTSEVNVSYYLIEKSTNGSEYAKVSNRTAVGSSKYSYSYTRSWFSKKPIYRISAIFKDGTRGIPITFK